MHFVLLREPDGPVTNSECDEKGIVLGDYIHRLCKTLTSIGWTGINKTAI